MVWVYLAVAIALLVKESAGAASENTRNHVYMQGFNWYLIQNETREVYHQLVQREVKNMEGIIDGVWLPPPSQSADGAGYMPGKWYELRDEVGLRGLVDSLHNASMDAIVDVVVNHRTGASIDECTEQWTNMENPPMAAWAIVQNDKNCKVDKPTCPSHCGCAASEDTGDNFCAAPDLDHTNPKVREMVVEFLNWLRKDVGYDSFRLDMVKGFDAKYIAEYMRATNPKYVVGEFFDGNTKLVEDWIESAERTSGAYDFPLRFILDDAIKKNDFWQLQTAENHPAGLIGKYKTLSATFLDNHDTGSHATPFGDLDPLKIIQGYAYTMMHPGNPFIFWDHWVHDQIQPVLKELVQIRKRNNIQADANIWIAQRRRGLYATYLGAQVDQCEGTIAMKLGSDDWAPCGDNWNLAASGHHYAIWEKQQ